MTQLLWMGPVDPLKPDQPNPNYLKEFDGTVTKVLDGGRVLLDQTAFYATGGGQPHDTGILTWDGGEARVVDVSKKGVHKHILEGEVPEAGTLVHGEIDWDRRHDLMRMHTCQHVISAVVHDTWGANTAGNQIGTDQTRIDFEHSFDQDMVSQLEDDVNELLRKGLVIQVYEQPREVAEQEAKDRTLISRLPKSVRKLRIVEILDPEDTTNKVDYCPCAGTHVANTKEIGQIEITGRKSKGKGRDRIKYELR